ncbi:MAG: hypothetical protein FE78DRAFT_33359 [Acidomyces sp. 'richmondensis']|nr:MAG: hypothetical protein FE78DRAFT_33359 [Acidomyces sp. 'richmondensis']
MFNSQNNVLHDKAVKPVPSVWTVTKVLDVEPFINETLNMFTTIWRAIAWDVTTNLTFSVVAQHQYEFQAQGGDLPPRITEHSFDKNIKLKKA